MGSSKQELVEEERIQAYMKKSRIKVKDEA
jgi:hypothetical protein